MEKENFENIEDIKIDKAELIKQTQEQIRKTDHYIEVSLVLGEKTDAVMPRINIHNVTNEEIAKMICSLENIVKILKNDYPMANLMSNFFGTKEEKL